MKRCKLQSPKEKPLEASQGVSLRHGSVEKPLNRRAGYGALRTSFSRRDNYTKRTGQSLKEKVLAMHTGDLAFSLVHTLGSTGEALKGESPHVQNM